MLAFHIFMHWKLLLAIGLEKRPQAERHGYNKVSNGIFETGHRAPATNDTGNIDRDAAGLPELGFILVSWFCYCYMATQPWAAVGHNAILQPK